MVFKDIVFGGHGNKIFALDANSGELRWKFDIEDNEMVIGSSFYNETLFVTSNQSRLYALNLNGSIKWVKCVDQFLYSDIGLSNPMIDNGIISMASR